MLWCNADNCPVSEHKDCHPYHGMCEDCFYSEPASLWRVLAWKVRAWLFRIGLFLATLLALGTVLAMPVRADYRPTAKHNPSHYCPALYAWVCSGKTSVKAMWDKQTKTLVATLNDTSRTVIVCQGGHCKTTFPTRGPAINTVAKNGAARGLPVLTLKGAQLAEALAGASGSGVVFTTRAAVCQTWQTWQGCQRGIPE